MTDQTERGPVARSLARQRPLTREDAVGMASRVPGVEPSSLVATARAIVAYVNDETPTEPQPPAHGFAVGDEVTASRMLDLPHGSVIRDRDDDTYERTDDPEYEGPGEHWQHVWSDSPGEYGSHYSAAEVWTYAPIHVHSLPEPEVVTPPADPDEHPARERGSWVPSGGVDSPDTEPRENIEQIVGEALGAASTAWTASPRGTFESSYVSGIVDTLMAAIDRYADGDGPHVEIGGQRMTEAQYNAVRESIVGTPGPVEPKVGDRVRVTHARTRFHAACVGHTGVLDQLPGRPNTYRVHDETTGQAHHGPLSDFEVVAPTAPAPEPRVGDEVRVIDNPVGLKRHEAEGHRPCGGKRGTLQRHNERLSDGDEYVAGGHIGPLSDFERVGD